MHNCFLTAARERTLPFSRLMASGLFMLMLALASCAPMSIPDGVLDPDGDGTLGGNVVDESPSQSWRATTTSIESIHPLLSFAEMIYTFSAEGVLEQVEVVHFDFSSDPELFAGIEAINTVIPVGIETEILRRVTVGDTSSLQSEERTVILYSRGDLAFAADGTVSHNIDFTFRIDTYFSNPLEGSESALIGMGSLGFAATFTGRLSEDGATIEWLSIEGEGTTASSVVGSPVQESTDSISQVFPEGQTPTWTLVTDE